MELSKKMIRLTKDRFRADVAREARLPATAISNYINKQQVPRADRALALARALKVPLEWLVDDKQDWPPPDQTKLRIEDVSTGQLIRELARRYRLEMLDLLPLWNEVQSIDWAALQKSLPAKGEPVSANVKRQLGLLYRWYEHWWAIQGRYDPQFVADMMHAELPGADLPLEATQIWTLDKRLFARADKDALFEVLGWMRNHHEELELPLPLRLMDALAVQTEDGRRRILAESAKAAKRQPASPSRRR